MAHMATASAASAPPPHHVVIYGGGVVGACTAYFLSTHVASPTVPTLVGKSSPACVAFGKTDGFLALLHDPGEKMGSSPAKFRRGRREHVVERDDAKLKRWIKKGEAHQ